jgi:hypothetical protein
MVSQKTLERRRQLRNERFAKGQCARCPVKIDARSKRYCTKHLDQKNSYNRKYYATSEYARHQNLERNKRRQAELRRIKNEYKAAHPCCDCIAEGRDGKWDIEVLDFDHRDSTIKKFDISQVVRHFRTVKDLMDEIAKCDVVCANHHRLRTKNRRLQKKNNND